MLNSTLNCRHYTFIGLLLVAAAALPAESADAPPGFCPRDFRLDTRDAKNWPRFQYHWRLAAQLPDGTVLQRRLVVERDGQRHAALVMNGDGFPLGYLTDNSILCLSADRPGEWTHYSGASFQFFLGIDADGEFGFSQTGGAPAGFSFSRCDVSGVVQSLLRDAQTPLAEPKGDFLIFDGTDGSKSVIQRRWWWAFARPPIESLRFQGKRATLDIYGIDTSGQLPLSILKLLPDTAPGEPIPTTSRTIRHSAEKMPEVFHLCQPLSVDDEAALRASTRLHQRFERHGFAAVAQEKREAVEALLANEGELAAAPPRRFNVSAFSRVLNECYAGEKEEAATRGRPFLRPRDPYVAAWRFEAGFGPLLAGQVRERLLEEAADRNRNLITRLPAFSCVCETGWLPADNAKARKIVADLRAEAPPVMKTLEKFAVDWQLVEARP